MFTVFYRQCLDDNFADRCNQDMFPAPESGYHIERLWNIHLFLVVLIKLIIVEVY